MMASTASGRLWRAVPTLAASLLAAAFLIALVLQPAPARAESRQLLGFNENAFEFHGGAHIPEQRIAKQAAATGAEVQRFVLAWKEVEPQQGTWNWERYDRAVEVMGRQGLRPLIVIEAAPDWATDLGCAGRACPPTDARLPAWANFASRVAQRYREAVAIEVWHGENNNGHWNTIVGADPERYARVFAAAANAIHSTRPALPVLIGGIEAIPDDFFDMDPAAFLDQFYAALPAGVMQKADGLAVRAFSSPQDVRALKGAAGHHLDVVRAAIRRNDPGRRIWITEAGITTTGAGGLSEEKQRQGIATLLDRTRAMPDIRAVMIHALFDHPAHETVSQRGWGMLEAAPTFAAKPAYCQLVARVVGPLAKLGCKVRRDFSILKLKRSKRQGSARLKISVPGPGLVKLRRNRFLQRVVSHPTAAGKLPLQVRLTRKGRRKLAIDRGRISKLAVRARVSFTPDHAAPALLGRRFQILKRR